VDVAIRKTAPTLYWRIRPLICHPYADLGFIDLFWRCLFTNVFVCNPKNSASFTEVDICSDFVSPCR
jgi:hypothetical protein